MANLEGHTLKAPAVYEPENEWKGVSEEPQTSNELRIISLDSQKIQYEVERLFNFD